MKIYAFFRKRELQGSYNKTELIHEFKRLVATSAARVNVAFRISGD